MRFFYRHDGYIRTGTASAGRDNRAFRRQMRGNFAFARVISQRKGFTADISARQRDRPTGKTVGNTVSTEISTRFFPFFGRKCKYNS